MMKARQSFETIFKGMLLFILVIIAINVVFTLWVLALAYHPGTDWFGMILAARFAEIIFGMILGACALVLGVLLSWLGVTAASDLRIASSGKLPGVSLQTSAPGPAHAWWHRPDRRLPVQTRRLHRKLCRYTPRFRR